jgi:hypothetical protein
MMEQNSLIVTTALQMPGNSDRPLAWLVDQYESDRLLKPYFQREWCWTSGKSKEWIQSVVNAVAIGCIVTYQISNGDGSAGSGSHPIYLADGLQRITATSKFLRNPSEFIDHCGLEQAREYCMNYLVTVQHRHYKNHEAAMEAFQNLNKGTALTKKELYSGEMRKNQLTARIYDEVPAILDRWEFSMMSSARERNSREWQSKSFRDALSCFFQYAIKTERMDFWGTAEIRSDPRKSILERQLSEHILKIGESETENLVGQFSDFCASHYQLLQNRIIKSGVPSKPISWVFARWTLHANIWRRNSTRPLQQFVDILDYLIENQKDNPTIGGRIFDKERSIDQTLNSDKLTALKNICSGLGIVGFYDGAKRKRIPQRPGNDTSHVLPFSIYGDGPTIPEPSQINRSRGASPIISTGGDD